MCTNTYSNKERYDKVIAKTKWCSFYASQCSIKLVLCELYFLRFGLYNITLVFEYNELLALPPQVAQLPEPLLMWLH